MIGAPASLASIASQMPDPPLVPSGDQGRSLLRRELLAPEYTRDSLINRILNWFFDQFSAVADRASQASTWVTAAAVLVAIVIIAALILLLSRARWRSRAAAPESSAVLLDDGLSADQLRARAELALTQGRSEDALVDGYRAIAVRAIERRRIDDLPGATAHEIAIALAEAFGGPAERGEQGDQLRAAAELFDLVLYGDRSATAAQARAVLALDDNLVGVS